MKKIMTAALAVTLMMTMSVSVSATGYAGYPWNTPLYSSDDDSYTEFSGSSSITGYVPAGGTSGTTTIADNQTPLAGVPVISLKNNNGAKALAASGITTVNGKLTATNVSVINPAVLGAHSGILNCDLRIANKLISRVYVDTAALKSSNQSIDVSMSIDPLDTSATIKQFTNSFGGNVAAVVLGQQGNFPTPTKIAINASVFANVDSANMNVIIHNVGLNKYTVLPKDAYYIENRFLYVTTTLTGTIVLTDSVKFNSAS